MPNDIAYLRRTLWVKEPRPSETVSEKKRYLHRGTRCFRYNRKSNPMSSPMPMPIPMYMPIYTQEEIVLGTKMEMALFRRFYG